MNNYSEMVAVQSMLDDVYDIMQSLDNVDTLINNYELKENMEAVELLHHAMNKCNNVHDVINGLIKNSKESSWMIYMKK